MNNIKNELFKRFIVLISLFVIFSLPTYAQWWDSNWRYRIPITIQERSGNNLIDYPINITIDTASLISQGKMRADCGDIRFTYVYPNGTEVRIPYWLDYGCNTQNTRIWVKVPSIPANGQVTIYMYYGNPYATSESNEAEVDVWQLREFDMYDIGRPYIIFDVYNDRLSYLRIRSTYQPPYFPPPYELVGRGYLFTQIPRSWVDGMNISIYWRGISSAVIIVGTFHIFNATFHRTDTTQYMVPDSNEERIFNVNNVELAYVASCEAPVCPWITSSNIPSLTNYNNYVTLLVRLISEGYLEELNVAQINITYPNGTLFKSFDFNGCVVMEVTGTTNDYGVFRKCVSPEPSYTIGQEQQNTCMPPPLGDWIINTYCTVTSNVTVNGNLILVRGGVLTVIGATVTVKGIVIFSGGSVVLVNKGGLAIIK